jgi:hypothetical protein
VPSFANELSRKSQQNKHTQKKIPKEEFSSSIFFFFFFFEFAGKVVEEWQQLVGDGCWWQ